MNPEPLPEISVPDQDYTRIWAEKTARVLEQLQGSPFTATPRPPAVAEGSITGASEPLWINFKVSGKLTGDQAMEFSASDGVRMAQMLMAEAVDGTIAPTEGHTDALNELFRQFAGMAATECKAKYGATVEFHLDSAIPPQWQSASQASWIFAAPQIAPLQWKLLVSAELHASLAAATEIKPRSEAAETKRDAKSPMLATAPTTATLPAEDRTSQPVAALGESASASLPTADVNAANLDLLLDVELYASLRFGQREMLLREILDLRPGSVVELNRQLQEPAELLVGGRVIARGEVVIVDGNYGLRITDIVQAQKRLESLRT